MTKTVQLEVGQASYDIDGGQPVLGSRSAGVVMRRVDGMWLWESRKTPARDTLQEQLDAGFARAEAEWPEWGCVLCCSAREAGLPGTPYSFDAYWYGRYPRQPDECPQCGGNVGI
jgi:hypothetical protein